MAKPIKFGRVLRQGSHGSDVYAVERSLARAADKGKLDEAQDEFTPTWVTRLRTFQKNHKLKADGIYGPGTHKELTPHFDDYARDVYLHYRPPVGVQLPASFNPTHDTAGLPGYPAIDILARQGARVLAPANGVISKLSGHPPRPVNPGGAFGWSIYLRASGATYFLTHFGTRDVVLNQKVRAGDLLGTVGNFNYYSGYVTPNHIHEGKHS